MTAQAFIKTINFVVKLFVLIPFLDDNNNSMQNAASRRANWAYSITFAIIFNALVWYSFKEYTESP